MPRARYFAHANINTADYDRSEEFYSAVLGLTTMGPTTPDRIQDGAPFELPGEIDWRGGFLADGRGLRGPVVDILEWTKPPTSPNPSEDKVPGLKALGFTVGHAGALLRELESRGLAARRARIIYGMEARDVILTTDIDGTPLEITENPVYPRYESIRLYTRDLDVSARFYRDALHLDTDEPTGYRVEADGEVIAAGRNIRAYLPGQRDKFWLNLTEPQDAMAMPGTARKANSAGLFRMALLVDDINEAYDDLRALVPDIAPPVLNYVGDQYDPVQVMFFKDPDGTVVEYLVGIFVPKS
jgi:catechol 2,3-dioxygenase-like lactoylglutathione lyase family enzyme